MKFRVVADSSGDVGLAPAFLRAILVAALLTSCAKVDQTTGGAAPGAETATKRPADSMLAYEHAFSVLLASQDVSPRFEAVRAACLKAERGTCTLLTAELSSGEYTRAKIVARVQPEFVGRLVEIASVGGEIEEQTTKAEDLTAPVTDTERNLAWLTRHRDRLIAFQDRKDINVEQLIQLSEQIARTQSNGRLLAPTTKSARSTMPPDRGARRSRFR